MAEENKVLTRAEQNPADTWNMDDLFPSDEAWRCALEEAKGYEEKVAGFQGRLKESPQALLELLELEDEMTVAYDPILRYASQKLDEDTANSRYQEMQAQVMSQYVALCSACAFETPELLSIPDETMEDYYRQEPRLEGYRLAIDRVRRKKAHTLSDAEERLLAMTGEMSQSAEQIFSVLSDADLTFPDAVASDGTKWPVTHGTYGVIMDQQDRALRKSAFQSMYGVYGSFVNTFASILSAQVKQLQFYARVRKYPNSLAAALDATEVPEQVYTNLIQAMHDNMEEMYRYIRLRKKRMGVEELHMYDLYPSMVKDVEWRFTFEEAKEVVLKAMAPLGEDYVALLKEGFDNRWIDVYENQGKRSGAYSSGARVHPYVLLNFHGTLDDVFTLAHEMGHSIHSYLSNQNQPVVYSDYVIFVAEVASTCNEALLMEYLLSVTEDKKRRAYLINHFLEQFRTTLYRQTMFAEFELEVNRMDERGEGITADSCNALYYKLNQLYYGPDVVSDEEIRLEWARIPHFYYNYYVYQYATGYAAAIALSRRILREGEPAVKDYLNFLSGGCSADPITLLRGAGVDMASPEPVNQALALFGELIDELDALTED